jgi:hypothetical protein
MDAVIAIEDIPVANVRAGMTGTIVDIDRTRHVLAVDLDNNGVIRDLPASAFAPRDRDGTSGRSGAPRPMPHLTP